MPTLPDRADFDPTSVTWRYVKAWAATRLVTLRAELEDETITDARTAALRGRIGEIKTLIALDQPRPDIPAGSEPYS